MRYFVRMKLPPAMSLNPGHKQVFRHPEPFVWQNYKLICLQKKAEKQKARLSFLKRAS